MKVNILCFNTAAETNWIHLKFSVGVANLYNNAATNYSMLKVGDPKYIG